MANLFLVSDTHFGHANMLGFTINESGTLLRPGFKDVSHMDETMIQRWNSVVKPKDHVYHLGDVAMSKRFLPLVRRLNGKKRLVFGNHDIYDFKLYAEAGFEKLMGMRVFEGMIFTHVPIHHKNLERFRVNVHGHLHQNVVKLDNGHPDPRYFSVCVEKINYTPIPLEEVKRKIS